MVRAGNRLIALVTGRFRRTFHYDSISAWQDRLRALGFEIIASTPNRGGPFANFVLYARPSRDWLV